MKPIVLRDAAAQEVGEAIDHYESERPGLGSQFRDEFERSIACSVEFD